MVCWFGFLVSLCLAVNGATSTGAATSTVFDTMYKLQKCVTYCSWTWCSQSAEVQSYVPLTYSGFDG